MVIRFFLSAVAPGDLEEVVRRFREDVVPAFTAHPSCLGVELLMASSEGAGGLVEGGALTRWTSEEEMEAALSDPALQQAQARVRELLRREPVRAVYRVML